MKKKFFLNYKRIYPSENVWNIFSKNENASFQKSYQSDNPPQSGILYSVFVRNTQFCRKEKCHEEDVNRETALQEEGHPSGSVNQIALKIKES